ncbi:MAG: hypothetical protein IT462_11610 [Planctomycetes bacterium]|nr:hypothetical protein [Planctomycetota bacterium]
MRELMDCALSQVIPGVMGTPDYDIAVRIVRAYALKSPEQIVLTCRDYRIAGYSPEMMNMAQDQLAPALGPLRTIFPQYASSDCHHAR